MSGVFGVWHLDGRPADRGELARSCATLAHRGRDHEGVCIDGRVGFACRLSRVTPESRDERQPIVDAGGAMLVFDGRLDNRDELLDCLDDTAPVSHASPDSAIALAAYRACGDGFAATLNGDFALALFDRGRHQLMLARDALGVRPLFYYVTPAIVLFASEIKALLSHPAVDSHPDDDALAAFLIERFGQEHASGETFFTGIFGVVPGHRVIVTQTAVRTARDWDFDPAREVRFARVDDYADAFAQHFERAVRRRLRSAAPVAVSVSGGLDSSAIFCVADRIRRSNLHNTPEIRGFSHTFPAGSPSDEARYLSDIERVCNVRIQRLNDVAARLPCDARDAIRHVEAPFLTDQWNRTHTALEAIADSGATVVLTGHWGDQFLFDRAYLMDLCRRGALRTAWRHTGEHDRVAQPAVSRVRQLLTVFLMYNAPDSALNALRAAWRRVRRRPELRPWYTDAFRRRATVRQRLRPQSSGTAHARSIYHEARSRYHVLCMEWNNKAAAMHGVEIAFPFLDRDLIAFVMAIPGEMLNWNGAPKGLFREALRGALPAAVIDRRSKADFTDVVNRQLTVDYDRFVTAVLADRVVAARGYVDGDRLVAAICDRTPLVTAKTSQAATARLDLLALELWLHEFFDADRTYALTEVL
jgi:asparagine synthase (glutamine-hydrolysing)